MYKTNKDGSSEKLSDLMLVDCCYNLCVQSNMDRLDIGEKQMAVMRYHELVWTFGTEIMSSGRFNNLQRSPGVTLPI